MSSKKKIRYLNRNNRRRFVDPLKTGRKGIGRTAECKYLTLPRLSNLRSNGVQGEGLLKGSPSFAASRIVIKGEIELTHCMSVAVRSVRVSASIAASHAAIEFIIIIRPEYRERAWWFNPVEMVFFSLCEIYKEAYVWSITLLLWESASLISRFVYNAVRYFNLLKLALWRYIADNWWQLQVILLKREKNYINLLRFHYMCESTMCVNQTFMIYFF